MEISMQHPGWPASSETFFSRGDYHRRLPGSMGVTLLDSLFGRSGQRRTCASLYIPSGVLGRPYGFQALQQEISGKTVGVLADNTSGLSCLKKEGGGGMVSGVQLSSSRDSSSGRGLPHLPSSSLVRQ